MVVSGASGSSSAVVKIVPRNSQEPNSRLTRLVCLPCQPSPAACGQRLFHHRRGVDEHLHVAAGARRDLAGDLLQPALDHVVIVAVPRIDRDRAAVAPGQDARADRWSGP